MPAKKTSTAAKLNATGTPKKAAVKRAAAKTTTAKAAAKTAPEVAVEAQAEAVQEAVSIMARLQNNMRELNAALGESRVKLGDGNREVAMRVLSHAQTNAEQSFETLRKVVSSGSISDALKIQQDALRDALERNLEQAKDVGEIANETRKTVMAPVTTLFRKETA